MSGNPPYGGIIHHYRWDMFSLPLMFRPARFPSSFEVAHQLVMFLKTGPPRPCISLPKKTLVKRIPLSFGQKEWNHVVYVVFFWGFGCGFLWYLDVPWLQLGSWVRHQASSKSRPTWRNVLKASCVREPRATVGMCIPWVLWPLKPQKEPIGITHCG